MTTYGNLPAPRQGLILTRFLTCATSPSRGTSTPTSLAGRWCWRKSRHRQGRQQLDHHEPGRRADPGQARRHPGATRARGPGVGVHQRAGGRHRSFHREATAKGAQFLTEPLDRKAELRCYLRDPDGYLVEVGQATGMLEGVFADPPAGNQR
jgi:catechol 2,3-dioxygenase-like lactoylglutathione lyase family enzyme